MEKLKNNFLLKPILFSLGLCFIQSLAAQNIFINKNYQKIWEAKDRHDIKFTLAVLNTGSVEQKLLALKGLQSWHDSALRKQLVRQLKEGNEPIKIAALEAIGQSRDSFYIPSLLKTIHQLPEQTLKPAALVALGKCITKSKGHELLNITNAEQAGYAECMYRAMLKGVGAISLTDTMVNLLSKKDKENRFYAAWYLSRTPYVAQSKHLGEIIAINEQASQARGESGLSIPLIMALGKGKYEPQDSILLTHYLRVKTKMNRTEMALNAVSTYRAMAYNASAYDSNHCLNTSWMDEMYFPSVQLAYSELASKNCSSFYKKQYKLTYAPALVNLIKTKKRDTALYQLPINQTFYDTIWSLQLMEDDHRFYQNIKKSVIQSHLPAIKSAATEALVKCRNSKGFPDSLSLDFNETITFLIKDGDEGVLSIIANALLDKHIALEPNYKELLMEAQSKLKLPVEMEAFIDIAKVLAKINGSVYKRPDPQWNHPIDWEYVSKIKVDHKVKVITNKGHFIIQMNVNEAPGSVASILKLVEKGFYNGKYFHRMVPNFVVQGGCPRGDGFGGVDYTIRSDFSSLKYRAGAVGLASSGPDTESCQWFVTHCATPHLDGRYTIIGYVVEGMDTVHKLGVGDRMIKVERIF